MSSDDWLWDGSATPDPADARIANALKGLAYDGEPPALPIEKPPRSRAPMAGLAILLALAAAAVLALRPPPPEASPAVEPAPIIASATPWGVEPVDGVPNCGDVPVTTDRRLDLGSWLSTDPDDAARVTVADLGYLELAPSSALRLISSTAEQHRLELAHGKIEVQVTAPPRALVIDTPGGELVDLGCAYTMEIASNGYGELAVTDGWVSIEHPEATVLVPEGASARTRGPLGPTLPVFLDADPELAKRALLAAEEGATDEDLSWILENARPRDTLTLIHLLERLGVPQREAVFDRTVQLVGPVSVDREQVLALDRPSLGQLVQDASNRW